MCCLRQLVCRFYRYLSLRHEWITNVPFVLSSSHRMFRSSVLYENGAYSCSFWQAAPEWHSACLLWAVLQQDTEPPSLPWPIMFHRFHDRAGQDPDMVRKWQKISCTCHKGKLSLQALTRTATMIISDSKSIVDLCICQRHWRLFFGLFRQYFCVKI